MLHIDDGWPAGVAVMAVFTRAWRNKTAPMQVNSTPYQNKKGVGDVAVATPELTPNFNKLKHNLNYPKRYPAKTHLA